MLLRSSVSVSEPECDECSPALLRWCLLDGDSGACSSGGGLVWRGVSVSSERSSSSCGGASVVTRERFAMDSVTAENSDEDM